MKRFIQGQDRSQSTLFPESLEDYIADDNTVRVVDAYVDELDLHAMGFERVQPKATGRPGYVDAFNELSEQTDNRLIVATGQDGAIDGCLQLTIISGLARLGMKRALIEGVRVAHAQRRSGLGQLFFEYAISEARKAGCGLIQLTTDKSRIDAHRFYERLGFVDSHLGMKLHLT